MPISASISVLCDPPLSMPCKVDVKKHALLHGSPHTTTCGTVPTQDKPVSVGTLPPPPPLHTRHGQNRPHVARPQW